MGNDNWDISKANKQCPMQNSGSVWWRIWVSTQICGEWKWNNCRVCQGENLTELLHGCDEVNLIRQMIKNSPHLPSFPPIIHITSILHVFERDFTLTTYTLRWKLHWWEFEREQHWDENHTSSSTSELGTLPQFLYETTLGYSLESCASSAPHPSFHPWRNCRHFGCVNPTSFGGVSSAVSLWPRHTNTIILSRMCKRTQWRDNPWTIEGKLGIFTQFIARLPIGLIGHSPQ